MSNDEHELNKLEYEKILLDSSFKEANLYWVRNSAFFIFQTLFLSFLLKGVLDGSICKCKCFIVVIEIIGLLISIIHIIVLISSKKFNLMWVDELEKEAANGEIYKNNGYEKKLRIVLGKYNKQGLASVFNLTVLVASFLLAIWILLIIFRLVKLFSVNLRLGLFSR